MPWSIKKRGDRFCVVREDGSTEACHDTKSDANDHMKALYANDPNAGVENRIEAMKVERRAGRRAGNQWCIADHRGKLVSCHESRAVAERKLSERVAQGGTNLSVIEQAAIVIEQQDNQWCVALDSGARFCFGTQQEAQDLAKAFEDYAEDESEDDEGEDADEMDPMLPEAEPMPTMAATGAPRTWRGVLAMIGSTDDGRFFADFAWREPPLSFMCQIATPEAGAHAGAQVAGRIDWLERRGRAIVGGGVWNDDEFGQYAAARCGDGSLTGVSIDAVGQAEFRCTEFDTSDPGMPQCLNVVLAFDQATICAATQLATPAFQSATIEAVPDGESAEEASSALVRLQAAAEAKLPPDPSFPEPPAIERSPVDDLFDALFASAGVSDQAWGDFTAADYTPEQWKRSCLVDTEEGDAASKDRYKVPVREPDGTLSRGGCHAASGGRGLSRVTGVSEDKRRAAARTLVGLYRGQLKEDPPASLLKMAGMSEAALIAMAGRPSEIAPPVEPPREWFEVAEPLEYTPLHITADGQVMGHIAQWGQCHTGYPGACVTPPPSPSGYAAFNLNMVVCADGSQVRTGPVTLTTSHANEHLDAGRTLNHYDNSGCAVADVVAYEGVIGPWVCGAARPTITPKQIREFHGSAPSGDWRPLRGGLDLVAVLMVNTPGFPPLVASGVRVRPDGTMEQESLILTSLPAGAEVVTPSSGADKRMARMEERLARVELIANAVFAEMEGQLFEALRASIEG